MNRWIMALFASVSMLFLASGCSSKDTQTPEQQKEVIRKEAQKGQEVLFKLDWK